VLKVPLNTFSQPVSVLFELMRWLSHVAECNRSLFFVVIAVLIGLDA